MPSESIGVGAPDRASGRADAAERLRAVLEDDYVALHRQVALAARKQPGRRTAEEVDELAAEALGEAARRILEDPGNYDAARSPFAWIVGVAMRVLGELGRVSGPRSRRVDLSADGWRTMQGRDDDPSTHLDLNTVLNRLSPADREALLYGRIKGLTGEALLRALGVRTESAARARIFRALNRAKGIARDAGEEVSR